MHSYYNKLDVLSCRLYLCHLIFCCLYVESCSLLRCHLVHSSACQNTCVLCSLEPCSVYRRRCAGPLCVDWYVASALLLYKKPQLEHSAWFGDGNRSVKSKSRPTATDGWPFYTYGLTYSCLLRSEIAVNPVRGLMGALEMSGTGPTKHCGIIKSPLVTLVIMYTAKLTQRPTLSYWVTVLSKRKKLHVLVLGIMGLESINEENTVPIMLLCWIITITFFSPPSDRDGDLWLPRQS